MALDIWYRTTGAAIWATLYVCLCVCKHKKIQNFVMQSVFHECSADFYDFLEQIQNSCNGRHVCNMLITVEVCLWWEK